VAEFDYVIVGAGPAGCVLANRLSANQDVTVLVVEAGDQDTNPLIHIPGGAVQLLGDPATAWHYPTRPFGPENAVEVWLRGKTLGGSSSVNGMVYNRGNRADYDALKDLGNPGWDWHHVLRAYKEIEDNPFGESPTRGAGGPLRLSTAQQAPLLDDVLAAGGKLGWLCAEDYNETDVERVGYTMATIRDGRRVSGATAFLHPVENRDNLTVAVRTLVDKVVVEDGRAVGVVGRQDGQAFEATARREVILTSGAIATTKLLQLSGIGPAAVLRAAGVDVVVDSPNLGARMLEHRAFQMQVRLNEDIGYNKFLSTPEGQQAAMEEYQRTQTGPLAAASFEVVGFFKSRPELDRPDAQFQIAQYSIAPREQGKPLEIEREPGMMGIGYALRPDSAGAIRITSADPDAPLDIDANYFATEQDRTTVVDIFRGLRRLFGTSPLADRVVRETVPGPEVETDQQILDFALTVGSAGYHAVGTCAMGPNDDDVVDPRLRVRGVANLRVVDASVFPTLVAGNLNGPVTAMAWRAADLILDRD
jgi:choline dehydrogenase-like flavoprotein